MEFKVTNSYSRDVLNYVNGTVKNIHYGDIHTKFKTLFDLQSEYAPFINPEVNITRISDDNFCMEGDIVFADASEDLNDVGKTIEIVNLGGEKLLAGLHTLLARPRINTFSKGFVGYLLQSHKVRTQIQREAQGTKVLSISAGRISKVKLTYPSIPEQEKIKKLLQLVDERISRSSKLIQQLETLMLGLREELFTKTFRFKDEHGNDFPDWESITLGELGSTYNGISGKTKENFGKGKRYIQYKQVFDSSKIEIEKCELVDIGEHENQNKVQFGDVFFTISSETPEEIGMSSVLLEEIEDIYLNSFCFGYRPHSLSRFNPHYARFLFRSNSFRDSIKKLAQGSTRYNMSKIELLKISISLPSIQEQLKIASCLTSLSDKIETEKNILVQYEQQKKYLLQHLFV